MREIELTRDKIALVDDEDFEWLNQWKWYAAGNYVRRNPGISMHRLIMGTLPKMEIHHKNGNGLDNRRANLVEMTESEHSKLLHKTLKQGRKPKRRLKSK